MVNEIIADFYDLPFLFRGTDTRFIRTPGHYGKFRLARRKAHIFSESKINPLNTDTG